MSFTASSLISGFVFGVIGIYLFRAGKKEVSFSWVLIAIALMSYTFFTAGTAYGAWLDWGIGLALCALAYWLRP